VVKRWDEKTDYQFFQLGTGLPTNSVYEIYRDRSASKITISSFEKKDQHAIGTLVCNNGIVSGFHCGNISDNRFKPNPQGGCGGRGLICANTWVKVNYGDATDKCTYGDSGGPAYANNRAYGIISLAHFDDTKCHYLVYTPISYLTDDYQSENMRVLTTP